MDDAKVRIELTLKISHEHIDGDSGWYIILETNGGRFIDALGPYSTERVAIDVHNEILANVRKVCN